MANHIQAAPFPPTAFPPVPLARLIDGRNGLRVVGDVQSHASELTRAVDGARARGLAILLLGDINDRGPDVVGAMRLALDLLRAGDGEIIPGNHDWKLARWTRGRHIDATSQGFPETVAQIAAEADGRAIADVYAAAVAHRPLWIALGKLVFVHAAFDPRMLALLPAPLLQDANRVPGKLGSLALYGETDGRVDADGRPIRTYRWVDKIPDGLVVHVGHDAVSLETPVFRRGASGGLVRHMDTGVDRGGTLSWIDLPPEAFVDPSRAEVVLPP
jgi:hypothetical protein